MFKGRFVRPICIFTFIKISVSDSKMAKAAVDLSGMESKEEGWLIKQFVCPWKKFDRPGLLSLAKWKISEPDNSNIPSDEKELDSKLPIIDVDPAKLDKPPADKIQITWIGHATVLVQFDGISVLSDPVFLDYCGPVKAVGYARYRKAACRIMDIPKLDAVIISHNHYDHLEADAVKEIHRRFPHAKWFVALKQKQWLRKTGVDEKCIHELDWWQEVVVNINEKSIKFVCTPSQHWCGRKPPLDMNQCLWCSWVVKGPTKSYYFAGDTGYYDRLFQAIGELYGPFDLASIPIGAYEPRYITEYQHVDPAGAVKIHKDINSKQSVAMHWGTFSLTNEFYLEPPRQVAEELERQMLGPGEFISLCHGETWCVGEAREEPPFMKNIEHKL